jgi:hypothetical protein
MSRKNVLKLAATRAATAPTPATLPTTASTADVRTPDVATEMAPAVTLRNRHFLLTLTAGDGLQCRLVHLPSGTLLAEGAYSYSFGNPVFSDVRDTSGTVVLNGKTATGIAIEHRFSADQSTSWIEESIKITNTSSHPHTQPFRCGFVLPVRDGTLKKYVFTAVPFRRESSPAAPDFLGGGGLIDQSRRRPPGVKKRYSDYSLNEILYRRRSYPNFVNERPEMQAFGMSVSFGPSRLFSENYASEGWVLTDGSNGFLISKYHQAMREYALLDRVYLPPGVTALRWGGGSAPDDMDGYIHLAPGSSHEFGVTRLSAFPGNLVRGYYVFRAEMESRGHGTPEKFDPPVHWNELYDNKLFCSGGPSFHVDPKNREKFYRLADMKEAAAKAQGMGCDALYLDPGWDTPQSSKLWGESRLGTIHDFIAMLKKDYSRLKLSLHTPLSGWTGRGCDVIKGSALINAVGAKTFFACGASTQYVEESARRLRALADAGVFFFMFDGTGYTGECWDPKHNHAVPSTLDEHVRATNQLARMVHQTHPHVLIEMHDQASGLRLGCPVPMYHGHGVDASGVRGFDERWAFEFMWNPMEDLMSGNSIALYYYNLAYSLPLYLHIDLRTDNRNALAFWWTASTCRHLGIGGTHSDPIVVEAQKRAMETYKRLKTYFATGVFYGIDEMTHVHSSRDSKSAVINCFNLNDRPVERDIVFEPAQLGLSTEKTYRFSGASLKEAGGPYICSVSVPAQGHTLIEVR